MRLTLNRKLLLLSGGTFVVLALLAALAIGHLLRLRSEMEYLAEDTHELDVTRAFDSALTRAVAEAAAYGQSGETAYHVAARAELRAARHTLTEIADDEGYATHIALDVLEPDFNGPRMDLLGAVERHVEALERAVSAGDRAAIDAATAELFTYKRGAAELEAAFATHRREDVQTVDAAAKRETRLAIGSVLALLVALVPLTALSYIGIRRSAIDPVQALATAAAAVANGNFEPRVRVTTRDEIGALQHAFNRMVGALQLQYTTLKSQAAQLAWTLDDAEQARSAAEAASQAKTMFLANMSHELRTPLNAILGYTELMREDALDAGVPTLLPDLDRVHLAGTQLLAIINDILDLSKIEAGKMTMLIEPVVVATIVEHVTLTVAPQLEQNGNRLVVENAVPDGLLETDETRLQQILLNLLSNAAKFTRNGRVVLSVRRELRSDGTWLGFEVADTGIGMTAEQVGRLFEPFVQADASTTRRYGGTGLGLALSQRLCAMLGGSLDVSSAPGAGSTFRLWLPASHRPALAAGAECQSPFCELPAWPPAAQG